MVYWSWPWVVDHVGSLGLCLVCEWVSVAMIAMDLGFGLRLKMKECMWIGFGLLCFQSNFTWESCGWPLVAWCEIYVVGYGYECSMVTGKAMFGSCKIFSRNAILRKRKTCSVVWLCCENYAGKLFLVFGLTCKKPIFRKWNTSQPLASTWSNHRHH